MKNINLTLHEIKTLPNLVNITNRIGRVVLQKTNYLPGSSLYVGDLEKGIYYVEIINRKGERVANRL